MWISPCRYQSINLHHPNTHDFHYTKVLYNNETYIIFFRHRSRTPFKKSECEEIRRIASKFNSIPCHRPCLQGIHQSLVDSPHKEAIMQFFITLGTSQRPSYIQWEYLHPERGCTYHPSPPGHNGRRFANNIFKCIFMNEMFWLSIRISLKFVTKGPFGNKPALVQVVAWRGTGGMPLPEPMVTQFSDAYMRH